MDASSFIPEIERLITKVTPSLHALEEAREVVVKRNREIVNSSSKAVEAVHSKDQRKALTYLKEAKNRLLEVYKLSEGGKRGSGFFEKIIMGGEQEYVEAVLTYSFAFSQPPKPFLTGLSINPVSIILGISDFAGELRRIFLDQLIKGDISKAKEILDTVKHIYSNLVTLDVRTSLLPGFKRKLDVMRHQIEAATQDLHLTITAKDLTQALSLHKERLGEEVED